MRSEVRRLIFVKHTSLSYHIEILTHMSKEDRYQAIVQMSSRLLQFEELYAKMVYQLNKEQKEELSTSQVEWYCSCVEEGQRWSFTVNSLLSSCVLEEEKWVLPVLSLSLDFCSLSSGQWMMRSFSLYFEKDGSECVDSGEKREAEEEEVDEECTIVLFTYRCLLTRSDSLLNVELITIGSPVHPFLPFSLFLFVGRRIHQRNLDHCESHANREWTISTALLFFRKARSFTSPTL